MLRRIPRPSPALVIAIIALVFSMAGGASAAKRLITGADIKDNSLTGADVRNGSLISADFRRGSVPKGPAGPSGVQGPPGVAGPAGAAGAAGAQGAPGLSGLEVVQSTTDADGGDKKNAAITCPSGKKAIAGGANIVGTTTDQGGPFILRSAPSGDTQWAVSANESSEFQGGSWALRVFAVCANVAS